jgi:hypothetical protein
MNKHFNHFELIKAKGPWPFITQRTYRLPDESHLVWRSREHRKHLQRIKIGRLIRLNDKLLGCLWMPEELNWWIGTVFALGSLFFAVGSILVLAPNLSKIWSLDANAINSIFFMGSIPFTIAAYLQLFQAANAGKFSPQGTRKSRRVVWFGWNPREIGWLSCALQFPGTLLFNVNTFNVMLPGLEWFQQDLVIWIPNFFGSILFLASGYLAFIETCHAHWAWEPTNLSWWVTFINLLGCVAFMISALFAFVPPKEPSFDAVTISVGFTLIGAIAFFLGSLLMLPETAKEEIK